MRRFLTRSLPRAAALILGGTLCLGLLVLGGALLWLRSPAGERQVASLLVRALAARGYALGLGSLSGPLPERVLLRDLTLADKDGPLASAAEVEARLDLRGLPEGILRLDLVRLRGAELVRLPRPAAPAAHPGAPPRASSGPPELPDLALPVALVLGELRLEGAVARTAALFAGAGNNPPGDLPGLGPVPRRVSLDGTVSASLAGGRLRADGDLALAADGGRHMRLRGSLDLSRAGGTLAAKGTAAAPLYLKNAQPHPAGLDYALSVALAGPVPAFSGRAELRGSGLRWPAPELDRLLGPSVTFAGTVAGGPARPWRLDLEEARAGTCRLSGGMSCDFPEDADPLRGRVAAQLTVAVDDLAPLETGVSGPVLAVLTAGGTLASPDVALRVSSPALDTPAGTLRRLAARVAAQGRLAPGAAEAWGSLEASAGESPAGPGEIACAWRAALPGGGRALSLGLRDLRAHLAGVALNGYLDAALPPGPGAGLPPLRGALSAAVGDWSGLAALAGTPLAGGPARAELRLDHAEGAGGQSAALSLTVDSLILPGRDVAVRQASLDARLERPWGGRAAPDPDLRATLRTGEGKAGPLRWSAGEASLRGGRSGTFRLALRDGPADRAATGARPRTGAGAKDGESARGKGAASARRAVSFREGVPAKDAVLALDGGYDLAGKTAALSALSLRVPGGKAGARLTGPLALDYADGLRVRGLKAALTPGGALAAEAELRPGAMRLDATLTALPLAAFALVTDAPLPEGRVDAQLAYAAGSGAPKGSLKLRVRAGGAGGGQKADGQGAFPPLSLRLDAALEKAAAGLRLRGEGTLGTPGNDGILRFSLPLAAKREGPPAPDAGGPLSASFTWDTPLAPLWRFAPLPGRSLEGRLALNAVLSGSLDAPRFEGTAYLAQGRYEDRMLGLLLTGMALEARAGPGGGRAGGSASGPEFGTARLVFAAGDGKGGSLALEGTLDLANDPSLSLRGQVRHLRPLHRDDLSLVLSGLFRASGPLSAPALEADIMVERGELNVSSVLEGGGVRTLDIGEAGRDPRKTGTGPLCDLRIEVPRRFFIRGRGLDSEWQGRLAVSGPLSGPSLTGSLRPVRGAFDLLSKRFTFTGGDITFAGGGRINPGINLELTYQGPDITALVNVGGSAQKPVLELASRPPLARDEVLAHVLFGKNASQLSRFETLQLANGLRELSGVGGSGLDVLGGMRKTLGLDVLRVGGGGSGARSLTDSGMSGAGDAPLSSRARKTGTQTPAADAPAIEAGKYLNDSIYVGVEQGATQESTGVRVEIELAPNISLQGKTSPNSSQVGIGWKKDY